MSSNLHRGFPFLSMTLLRVSHNLLLRARGLQKATQPVRQFIGMTCLIVAPSLVASAALTTLMKNINVARSSETRLPQASQSMGSRCSCPRRRAAPDFCLHPLPIPSSEIAVFRECDLCGSKGIVSRCTGAEGIPCGIFICIPCNADHAHLCPWCRNREMDPFLAQRPEVTRKS